MTDWSTGAYELTAQRLAPAARRAVEALHLSPGDRVVDVACGTGNAALEAARAGAAAVGFDRAERLVDVARGRAAEDGLDVRFDVAEATAMPVGDGAFDAAVSVFGVIFADGPEAASELLRVTRPGGRIVLTTWTTDGPTAQVMEVVREAVGAPARPPTWSDAGVVRGLFAQAEVTIAEEQLRFPAASVDAYLAEHRDHHPMWLEVVPALRAAGTLDDTLARVREVFADANEDPRAFLLTSPYRVVTVRVPR